MCVISSLDEGKMEPDQIGESLTYFTLLNVSLAQSWPTINCCLHTLLL